MYMRGKFFVFLLLSVMLLSGCQRVLQTPADEFPQYDWQSEQENGSVVTLDFDDGRCTFAIEGDTISSIISGVCFVTDDKLVICDEDNGQNYTFGYHLFGDRVELSYNGSVITLKKAE